ncbi:SMP-30/gluconolactonase/LRE family protein [Novosphingobium sp. PP1Y]|uniref:SMP-30/gluconolactonase/LRE family protein n=1 Tax=Novosphingobium sp. PP1Y TaxID=702113 RepID=UPI00020EED57|nr:SMP-30/gluconolactonase/LRE family protein [Novosphingobium sp. PP1Y]CCA92879.1 SMP-30/gluconolaconase/LRE domain-containing protein [Novosphingobium sp. PP1Y]
MTGRFLGSCAQARAGVRSLTRRSVLARTACLLAAAGASRRGLAREALPDGVRTIAKGLKFPEGLFTYPDGAIGCVEIAGGTLLRIDRRGRQEITARPGPGPNGAALLPDGSVLVADNGGIAFRRTEQGLRVAGLPADLAPGRIVRVAPDGAVESLYTQCDGAALNGPNDLILDGLGGFWFTDTGKLRPTGQDPGALYHARLDGSRIERVLHPLDAPNGLCRTPDGDLLVVLSKARTVLKLPARGDTLGPAAVFARLPGAMILDNIVCDEDGTTLIGCVRPGGIAVVSPGGILQALIALPDFAVTALAFAGEDRREVLACLSSTGRIVSLAWPRPGLDRAMVPGTA